MIVLCFTGPSGAGKSTLAREVARRHDAPRIVEHGVYHALARAAGCTRGRHWVRAVGVPAALTAVGTETIRQITALGAPPLVVLDGVYDRTFLAGLQRSFPHARVLVAAAVSPFATRCDRVACRTGLTPADAQTETVFLDGLKEAAGMNNLIARASVTIENDGTIAEAYERVRIVLESAV